MICPYCKKEIEPVEETTPSISVVKDKDGNIQTWTEETRDSDGVLIKKRVDGYVYFKSGGVNTINQKIFDGEDTLLSEKSIQHYEDGSQPVTTDQASVGGDQK